MVDLKERLIDGDIYSYSWLPTKKMWADMTTKKMMLHLALADVFLKNDLEIPQPLINEVRAIGTEIRMTNIRNR